MSKIIYIAYFKSLFLKKLFHKTCECKCLDKLETNPVNIELIQSKIKLCDKV